MAAANNQDFVTYAGDAVSPIFTVRTSGGTAVDISAVMDISWTAKLDATSAALVTKTKLTGGIVFVTDGTDGKFQVNILGTDTQDLSGYYIHEASLTQVDGEIVTVTVGRMQVGLVPQWTYNPALLGSNTLYQVRRLIGDVLQNDQQLLDPEISFAISLYSNIYLAGAECCRQIAAQFARKVDIVQGEMQTNYSNQAKAYTAKANELQAIGMGRGAGAMPFVGGISVTEKTAQVLNPDRVTPQFNIGMFDDLIIGQVGNETPANPSGGNFASDTSVGIPNP